MRIPITLTSRRQRICYRMGYEAGRTSAFKDALRIVKKIKKVAVALSPRETVPYSGRLLGKCAAGKCGHDDGSWCERGPDATVRRRK